MADFVDTNVLVYAWDQRDARKRDLARRLLRDTRPPVVWSTQVLQEFYVAVSRLPHPPSVPELTEGMRLLASRAHVVVDPELILAAVGTHRAHQLSFWDALIVESAVRAGSRRLYTEDLQHGAELRGVTVVNPFLETAG